MRWRLWLRLGFVALLASATAPAWAQGFTLASLNANVTDQRFKDIGGQVYDSTYIANYSYANANVSVSLPDVSDSYLPAQITATGLKPNFAYQVKFSGRPSASYASNADDAANERLGYMGRWWQFLHNPPFNSNDSDYAQHKNDPSYAYLGYLYGGFFVTDANGNASLTLPLYNSFHVTWRDNQNFAQGPGDGPLVTVNIPPTGSNPAYSSGGPARTFYLFGETELGRSTAGNLKMSPGHYVCDLVLTEESFHDTTPPNNGNWASVLGATVNFEIKATKNDFDGNRKADILFRHSSSGDVYLWLMNGLALKQEAFLCVTPQVRTSFPVISVVCFPSASIRTRRDFIYYFRH